MGRTNKITVEIKQNHENIQTKSKREEKERINEDKLELISLLKIQDGKKTKSKW